MYVRKCSYIYYFLFAKCAARVGCGHSGCAFLGVPWRELLLRRRAYRNCIYTASISIAVTIISLSATIARRPYVYHAFSASSLFLSTIHNHTCRCVLCNCLNPHILILTSVIPLTNASLASVPGPSSVRPSSFGPHDDEYISIYLFMSFKLLTQQVNISKYTNGSLIYLWLKAIACASVRSVMLPSSRRTPPILALKAIPTPQNPLFATMAISPAHRVPCLDTYTNYNYFIKDTKNIYLVFCLY